MAQSLQHFCKFPDAAAAPCICNLPPWSSTHSVGSQAQVRCRQLPYHLVMRCRRRKGVRPMTLDGCPVLSPFWTWCRPWSGRRESKGGVPPQEDPGEVTECLPAPYQPKGLSGGTLDGFCANWVPTFTEPDPFELPRPFQAAPPCTVSQWHGHLLACVGKCKVTAEVPHPDTTIWAKKAIQLRSYNNLGTG